MSDLVPGRTRPPIELEAPGTPSVKSLLALAVGVVVVAALYFAREVLIPITLAALLSFLLAPLVSFLKRLHVNRVVAVLTSILVTLGVLLSLTGLIGLQMAELVQELPRYQSTIQSKVEAVRGATFDRMAEQMKNIGKQLRDSNPPKPAGKQDGKKQAEAAPPMPVEVHQPDPTPIEVAERIVMPVLGPLTTIGVVFIVAMFILLQREDLRDRMIRLFGSRDLHRTTIAMNDAARRLSRYFLMQMAINATFGVVVGAGLFLIGIPSALLWGVMAALLRFLPYVGAPLAALLPLILAAAVDPGWSMVAWTAALYFVLEMTLAQAVEPLLYGRSTGLSPFSVVIAATFWIWLWGPIGLILSTPLTLCLVVLGKHVERLEFLEVLLGDRPALTQVESFYQRILAGDPDEVEEQAEAALKQCSLSSYYDDVALKGLQLASIDASRGVLTDRQVERMQSAITSVIEDLDTHDDIEPEADASKAGAGTEATMGPGVGMGAVTGTRIGAGTGIKTGGGTGVGIGAGTGNGIDAGIGNGPGAGDGGGSASMAGAPAGGDMRAGLSAKTALGVKVGGEVAGPPAPFMPEGAVFAPNWASGTTPVLIIAGRGPLDAAAVAILVQLLGKHGIGSRVVAQEDIGRGRLATLDIAGVEMVCLAYLGPTGTASHLRYLLRRLRGRMPGTPIVLSFWPTEDTAEGSDERARAAIGADYNATSFREVLGACFDKAVVKAGPPAPTAADAGMAA